VGGENFSLCGTSPGCTVVIVVAVVVDASVEWDVATSSVGRKSGTNFALKKMWIEKWRWDDKKILILKESENSKKKEL